MAKQNKQKPIYSQASKSSYLVIIPLKIFVWRYSIISVKRKEYEDVADTKDEMEKIMQFIMKKMPVKDRHQRMKTHWEFKFIDGQEIYIIQTVDSPHFYFFYLSSYKLMVTASGYTLSWLN